MADELISREAAKEEILAWARCIKNPKYLNAEDAMFVLDNLPTVNAVVLPCKVGDTVYYKQVLTCQKEIVTAIGVDDKGVYICTNCGVYGEHFFGKELFFTREEAEAVLKGREENAND